jgi:hypothetical protein
MAVLPVSPFKRQVLEVPVDVLVGKILIMQPN